MGDPSTITHPRLRAVDAFPVEFEGHELLCLRDPQGLADEPIIVDRLQFFIASRMDGTNSLREIQADVVRATGDIIPLEQIESLVAQFEARHYLDSPSFQEFYCGLVDSFRKAPSRPARHGGSAYKASPDELRRQIAGFFTHPDGPGGHAKLAGPLPLRGLIAPHIDFERGGPTYAHAYHALAGTRADRFVVFGTCHNAMQQRFAFTRKDFQTPLGPVATDGEFVDRLNRKLARDYLIDEFAHWGEHSIEFQIVFLQHRRGLFKIARPHQDIQVSIKALFRRIINRIAQVRAFEKDDFNGFSGQ